MQNEACIKQGSEKEPLRQQLKDAKQDLALVHESRYTDEAEKAACQAILDAAAQQRISPKAFIQAAKAAQDLVNARSVVLHIGYETEELVEFDGVDHLAQAARDYLTSRAVLLGFQKSLAPSGWDILED